MTDTSHDDLTYGHFGKCVYDTESKSWIWKRTLGSSNSLHPIGSHTLAVPSPIPVEHGWQKAETEKKISRSLRRTQQADLVIRASPDLAPALDLLPFNQRTSEKVESITARHDSRNGNCLATGRIYDELMHRSTSVVAFPGSASRTVLRLVQMRDQKQGWGNDKSIWLEVPKIQGESGSWDMGSSIQQILFSNDQDDGRQYLAVRTSTGTSVFRPLLRRHSTVGQDSDDPSRLALDPVAFVPSGHTASSAHVDVAFNPWYSKQFAIVDQSANWTIYDCVWDPDQSAVKMPVEVCKGGPLDTDRDELIGGAFIFDGWSRIAWVTNLSTIVTCSRRTIAIYDVSSTPVLLSSRLIGEEHSTLASDLQRDLHHTDRLFVLTTEHLICFRIDAPDDSRVGTKQQPTIMSMLRIRHFRDSGDMSLHMHVLIDQDDTTVLIKSSLSELITSHPFKTSQESSSDMVTASDSFLLPFPPTRKTSDQQFIILDLLLKPLDYGQSSEASRSRTSPSGPGLVYRQKNIKFWIATVVLSDLSIIQQLYYDTVGMNRSLAAAEFVSSPNWRSRLPQSTSRLVGDAFVVQDRVDEVAHLPNLRRPLQSPQSKRDDGSRASLDWTVNYERVYSAIAGVSTKDSQDVSQVLEMARSALGENDSSDGPLRLLSHLAEAELVVNDLDDASTTLHDLVSSAPSYDRPFDEAQGAPAMTIARLADVDLFNVDVESDDGLVLVSVYDSIVSHWLTPLSQQIPGRVRLAKEQLARRIAADVVLSSYCIRQVESTDSNHLVSVPSMAQDTDGQRPPGASASSQPISSFPTPSPTATPSLTSGSLSNHPFSLTSPEHSRLSRYTTFTGMAKPPSVLPKSLSSALAHWKLGEDPANYDWLAVKHAQDLEAEYDEQELTAKERARLKRRAERHLERQRKESATAASHGLASSQAPVIASASQPVPGDRGLDGGMSQPLVLLGSRSQPRDQNQKQSPSQLGLASQIEPGRFGGRLPVKKKRRTMGF